MYICLCVSLLTYTHTHTRLKGETVLINQAYNPRALPCQGHQAQPQLTSPHPSLHALILKALPSSKRAHSPPASPLYPPTKILLKTCLTCHPPLMLLGPLSPVPLSSPVFRGVCCAFASHMPLATPSRLSTSYRQDLCCVHPLCP